MESLAVIGDCTSWGAPHGGQPVKPKARGKRSVLRALISARVQLQSLLYYVYSLAICCKAHTPFSSQSLVLHKKAARCSNAHRSSQALLVNLLLPQAHPPLVVLLHANESALSSFKFYKRMEQIEGACSYSLYTSVPPALKIQHCKQIKENALKVRPSHKFVCS